MKKRIRNSISGLLLIPLLLVCFALLPSVQAAPDPAPPPGNNTRDGAGSMAHVTTGLGNTAFGTNALNTLTTGDSNAAQGASALFSCTDGNSNTGLGNAALRFLTTGDQNVAIGNTSLDSITTGSRNTGVGYGTLRSGNFSENTAVGWSAAINNTTGLRNTAVGTLALQANTGASDNTAVGHSALFSNTGGSFNVAVGTEALFNNIAAGSNTAVGFSALASANAGSNTAVGESALANTSGSNNIAVGAGAGLNLSGAGNFNIHIGNGGVNSDSATIRIGNAQLRTFIAGINGVNQGSPTAVFINTTTGQLGTTPPASSRRFKKEIQPMEQTSEAILGLRPVTFHYKNDATGTPQFGLIAEEVAAVNPDLVVRDENGEIYSVRYDAVNAMLLNEFLKEHRTVQGQQKEIDALKAELKEQKALIQKVSAQVEMSRPAPQTVLNDQ
jgi:hypothetical protein